MLRLAHIVNPVVVSESSDLFIAQPITFKTMEQAKYFARDWEVEVQLYTAHFPEDESLVPDNFVKTHPLNRCNFIGIEFSKAILQKRSAVVRQIILHYKQWKTSIDEIQSKNRQKFHHLFNQEQRDYIVLIC